jgi:hypothetical protein
MPARLVGRPVGVERGAQDASDLVPDGEISGSGGDLEPAAQLGIDIDREPDTACGRVRTFGLQLYKAVSSPQHPEDRLGD